MSDVQIKIWTMIGVGFLLHHAVVLLLIGLCTKRAAWQRALKSQERGSEQLNAARKGVHGEARDVVASWLSSLRKAARNCRNTIPKFLGSTWSACKSELGRIAARRWFVGVTLALVAIAGDFIYYRIFNFNILPYHSDPAGSALIMVVFVALVVAVALLGVSLVLFLSMISALFTLLWMITSLIWAVVFVIGRTSTYALRFYLDSEIFSQFTLLLAPSLAEFFKVLQDLRNAIDRKVTSLVDRIKKLGFFKRIRGKKVSVFQPFFLLLTTLALLYVLFIEPRYSAHDAYRGDNRVMVVVNQPPEGFSNPMIKIGSNRSYLFAVPDESQSTGDGCGSAGSAGLEQSGDGNGEWQNVGIVVAVEQWLLDPIQSLWSKLRLSAQDRLDFLLDFRPLDFKGAVIALPPPRVHCVYEEGSDKAAKLCESSADGEERLLRKQLAKEIGCQKLPIVSKPFVFMPDKWKEPKDGVEAQVKEFCRNYHSSRQKDRKRILYVFGFASADGPASHNKKLALKRAKTIRDLVKLWFPGWRIVPRFLGEDHLTNGVANSRSARLVFCAQSAPEAPS